MSEDYNQLFEVRLDLFDGPLDLLLHLVKKRELAIERVSLAMVAEQYLYAIRDAEFLDLELAGEYLNIATLLLSIKASFLLNDPVELVPDEDGTLVDPQEELLRRLRELEAIRHAAGLLGCKPYLGIDVFGPVSKMPRIDPDQIPLADHQAALLAKALSKVLAKLSVRGSELKITAETVSVVERMKVIIQRLQSSDGPISFYSLISDIQDKITLVGTFVGILELCKRHVIEVGQEEVFGEITIQLANSEPEIADLSHSEFDMMPEAANQ